MSGVSAACIESLKLVHDVGHCRGGGISSGYQDIDDLISNKAQVLYFPLQIGDEGGLLRVMLFVFKLI